MHTFRFNEKPVCTVLNGLELFSNFTRILDITKVTILSFVKFIYSEETTKDFFSFLWSSQNNLVLDTKIVISLGNKDSNHCHFWIMKKKLFSNFSCMFLNPNIFFGIWILIVLLYQIWETSRNKLKKHSVIVTKIFSDRSMFEQIVLLLGAK